MVQRVRIPYAVPTDIAPQDTHDTHPLPYSAAQARDILEDRIVDR